MTCPPHSGESKCGNFVNAVRSISFFAAPMARESSQPQFTRKKSSASSKLRIGVLCPRLVRKFWKLNSGHEKAQKSQNFAGFQSHQSHFLRILRLFAAKLLTEFVRITGQSHGFAGHESTAIAKNMPTQSRKIHVKKIREWAAKRHKMRKKRICIPPKLL